MVIAMTSPLEGNIPSPVRRCMVILAIAMKLLDLRVLLSRIRIFAIPEPVVKFGPVVLWISAGLVSAAEL
jgi:hypothetical protein